jgi:HSP20 family protein
MSRSAVTLTRTAHRRTVMGTRYGDVDTGLAVFDELRRRLDRVWADLEPGGNDARLAWGAGGFPRVNVYDAGTSFKIEAEIPGMSQNDIRLTVNETTLTLEGERKSDAPEGYSVHRRERGSLRFSRSFTLPTKTAAEHCEATVKDGVLTITLPKAKEAQPRQIEVRAN